MDTGIQDPPAPPSAIVLDMDGLMFNTEEMYDTVGEVVLGRRKRSFSPELKRKMMGRTAAAAFEVMRQHCGIEDSVSRLQTESDEIWLDLLPSRIAKLPGLDWLLDTADRCSIPLAVGTSSTRRLADAAIGHFGLLHRFRTIVTGDDVLRGKPDPEIYLQVAARLGISSRQMLVFEDSPTGSRAAVDSGAWTVAVPGIHNSAEDWSHVWRVVPALDAPLVRLLVDRWS